MSATRVCNQGSWSRLQAAGASATAGSASGATSLRARLKVLVEAAASRRAAAAAGFLWGVRCKKRGRDVQTYDWALSYLSFIAP